MIGWCSSSRAACPGDGCSPRQIAELVRRGTAVLHLGANVLLARDQLRLLGDHNVANALAAALAVQQRVYLRP